MTDWITDRLPTEADADENGDVYVCTSPQLNKELFDCENWHDVTLGWPWRHTDLWTPPTPAPEPTPAAPELEPEAKPGGWITRPPTLEDADCNGNVEYSYLCALSGIKNEYINWRLLTLTFGSVWRHTSLWKPPTPAAPEPKPEAEKAARGFAQIIWHPENQEQIAIATDGTAWRRFVVCGDWENWEQVTPLPQPGEE